MKPSFPNQRNQALTRIDKLVVIVVLLVLTAILLPALTAAKRRAQCIHCANNMKHINVAFRDWEGGHFDDYPMAVSVANGGMMELNNGRNAWINFAVLSNELSTPEILHCPADTQRIQTTNFNDLAGKISYFVNLDATEKHPQMLVFGDDNFAINGVLVKSGLLELSSNTPISWTVARHKLVGNISFVDGSVDELSTLGLRSAAARGERDWVKLGQGFELTGVTNNRLAIP